MTAALQALGVSAGYHGRAIVQEVDLAVEAGQIVALLGANGAGKTTTIRALSGQLPLLHGECRINGERTTASLDERVNAGLGLVLEERSIFTRLTVAENLRVARCATASALELFPELEPLLKRRAGVLSGGEQQMLALARALGRHPTLLLVDELSLGLAPLVVRRLMEALRQAAASGVAVLVVEQHVKQVLRIAHYAYVLQLGRIVLSGTADEVAPRIAEIEESYLSVAAGPPT